MRARVLGCAPSGKIVPKIYDLSLAIGELTMYRVSRVRVILLAHDGTFAAMRRHLVAEMDFSYSLRKYRAPMLYEADRSHE